jgi:hypothetical protein
MGEDGVVLAAHSDQWFAISTRWGNQLFEARTYCYDVVKGDGARFASSTGTCVSNTFVDLRTNRSCDVWCAASAEEGTVLSVSTSTILIATRNGNRDFEPRSSCRDVRAGDRVIFTRSTATCSSNTFLDLRSGGGCDVYCR